jgi:hypothetical protein
MEKNTISFDFDWTLRFGDGTAWMPNVKLMKRLIKNDHKVFIVTARLGTSDNVKEVNAFCDKHKIHNLAGIRFTEGNLKADTLVTLGVKVHFDDDGEECREATRRGIKTYQIWSAAHEEAWRHYSAGYGG